MDAKIYDDGDQSDEIEVLRLPSAFNRSRFTFYHGLRLVNSVLVSSATVWYCHYFLVRNDGEKSVSYFSNDAEVPKRDYLYRSRQRALLDAFTVSAGVSGVVSYALLWLKKRSLQQFLRRLKSSSASSSSSSHAPFTHVHQTYMHEPDLRQLNAWTCLLGGNNNSGVMILFMLYWTLLSETTYFGFLQSLRQQHYQAMPVDARECYDTRTDWKNRFFQYSNDDQAIAWNYSRAHEVAATVDFPALGLFEMDGMLRWHLLLCGTAAMVMSRSMFPISTLCALSVMKCGLNIEHQHECYQNWMRINKVLFCGALCLHGWNTFIDKSSMIHFLRFRRAKIAQCRQYIDEMPTNNHNKKEDEKKRFERRFKHIFSLKLFSYNMVDLLPWFCVFVSSHCAAASMYYVRTFSGTPFYEHVSRRKHEKNRKLLKVAAVSSLLVGVFVAIGKSTYLQSARYAKQWVMNTQQYSLESYQTQRQKQSALLTTPGDDQLQHDGADAQDSEFAEELKHEVEVSSEDEMHQIEGRERDRNKSSRKSLTAMEQKLVDNKFQQETQMLLSTNYFHQKAHDLFEYLAQVCVFVEDKLINRALIPSL